MRVIFMGTPAFSVPVLDALVEAGHDIAAVYTQPPRPAGRGKKARPSPVHARAEALGLEVQTPRSLKDAQVQADLAALDAEIGVVVAYGLLLPQAVLDAPSRGCLNVHASLLPRWRGAAPIHRAIMAGDTETGVCIMQMEAGLDTGPVLLRESCVIGETDTTGDLHDRLSEMGADLMRRCLGSLEGLEPVPQPEDGVTYAAKIDKAEAVVDWGQPAAVVARHINGLSPFPGAFVMPEGARLKLLRAQPVPDDGPAGSVLGDTGLRVACGSGAIEVLEVQPAGKQAQPAPEWRRGARLHPGAQLGG